MILNIACTIMSPWGAEWHVFINRCLLPSQVLHAKFGSCSSSCFYCDIVPLHNPLTNVRLEDACDVRLILSVNQSEWSFQSEFSGYTIFTFSISTKNMFCLRNGRSSVFGSSCCLGNQSNRSPLCQGIVYRYDITIPVVLEKKTTNDVLKMAICWNQSTDSTEKR